MLSARSARQRIAWGGVPIYREEPQEYGHFGTMSPRSGRQPWRWAAMGCRPLRGLEFFLRLILGLTPQALCRRPLRGLVSQLYDCPLMGLLKVSPPPSPGVNA